MSLGALFDCCFPPFHYAPRRVWEGVYTLNMDPLRSLKPSIAPALSILLPRPTQSQCLQLFHVGPKLQIPNQHSAAVAHLSAFFFFLHRRASVKLEKNWKRFQRKPSVLNIEEQSLPLSASYVLPNLVNLTLLCSKFSVAPGHTADSCSCPSGPARLFL